MISNISKVLYVILCGLFFGILQVGFFFILEMYLSSVYITYFIVVLGWLCGSWLGLKISLKNKELPFGLLSLCSIYLVYFLTKAISFQMVFLPLYLLLVAVSSLYAGYFFKEERYIFLEVKYLFFWENVGFIIGLVFSYISFIFFGIRLILYGPLLVFTLVCISFYFKKLLWRKGMILKKSNL